MSWRKTCILYPCAAAVFLLMAMVPAAAQSSMAAPDNSKMNKGDQSTSAMTADQQKNNATDLDMTKKIRHSLIQDKSLSTYAHNVKIISEGGKVTLKGPVRTDDEKKALIAKATEIAGAGQCERRVERRSQAVARTNSNRKETKWQARTHRHLAFTLIVQRWNMAWTP